MSKHYNLITYFGGKFPHLNWLIPLFPKGNYHFIDLMCGAANVALNVDYPLITINDLNDEVINLFEALRNEPNEFLRLLYFTPFSRAELYKIIDDEIPAGNKLEKARQYFVRCQLGYGANGSQNKHKGSGFEYMVQKSNFYRVDNWNKKLQKLDFIIQKLRGMQIEKRDSLKLIEKLDKPGNIIYIDPPYLMKLRNKKKRYIHEQDNDFHAELLEKAIKINDAYVAISCYDDIFYDKILLKNGWFKTIGNESKATVSKKTVRECLWTNYNPKLI